MDPISAFAKNAGALGPFRLMGFGDCLVGVDSTSHYPTAARVLPDVGYLRTLLAEVELSLETECILLNPDTFSASAPAQTFA